MLVGSTRTCETSEFFGAQRKKIVHRSLFFVFQKNRVMYTDTFFEVRSDFFKISQNTIRFFWCVHRFFKTRSDFFGVCTDFLKHVQIFLVCAQIF